MTKAYNNVVTPHIWDIELDHVAPPYLHILLGVVKKHHDLLEKECHYLDKQIALSLSKESEVNHAGFHPDFTKAVKHLQRLRGENKMEQLKHVTVFSELCGPVTANLETILVTHNIVAQAYHSRSFIGNHCNRYLDEAVITDLGHGILQRTYQVTDDHDLHNDAEGIKTKFIKLNRLFSAVHRLVSHTKPVSENNVSAIEDSITEYMTFYRSTFTDVRIIPKQHILESHCVPWIRNWGFGLGLHGEQGGEQIHALVNQLKRRAWGMKKDEDRLRVLMTEQLTRSSPMLQATPPKRAKQM